MIKCKDCPAWVERDDDEGRCHLFPPFVIYGNGIKHLWPITHKDDGCFQSPGYKIHSTEE